MTDTVEELNEVVGKQRRALEDDAAVERADVAKLTAEYDRLTREFAAMGYAARLTASTMEMLAAMGPNKAQDISFNMDGAGKSQAHVDRINGSNGHVTALDAAEIGL